MFITLSYAPYKYFYLLTNYFYFPEQVNIFTVIKLIFVCVNITFAIILPIICRYNYSESTDEQILQNPLSFKDKYIDMLHSHKYDRVISDNLNVFIMKTIILVIFSFLSSPCFILSFYVT